MNLSGIEPAVLVGLCVFMLLTGGYRLIRALQARENLIARAEGLGADPEVLSDPLRRESFLVRWSDRYDRSPAAQRVREQLRRAAVPWKPSDYYAIRVGLSFIIVIVCWMMLDLPIFGAALAGVVAYFIVPRIFFFMRQNAYVRAFNKQLVEITQLLANALRAGMSIQQAIGEVAGRVPEPARSEFRQTHHELLLGDNLPLALNDMRRRLSSRDLDVLVNAIVVQHQAGGNLVRVLNGMANTLNERQRLEREIDSLTAEARFSALVVMVLPIFFLLMIRDTPLGEALFQTVVGWVLLGIFAVLQVGIYFLIQRVARIEV
ncbi:MAG: type II secretion system F family protein [Roseiflexus sp.]